MEKRRLGKTEHLSSVVTFGSYSIGKLDQDSADDVIQLSLEHGVNHIDIAPGYANAMERVAPWMPDLRSKMFLGAKTPMRTRDDAWRNVEDIMHRMNVDSFDLFQLHSVIDIATLDTVTSDDGALQTLIEMREQGLTQWIGITGHGPSVPRTHKAFQLLNACGGCNRKQKPTSRSQPSQSISRLQKERNPHAELGPFRPRQ